VRVPLIKRVIEDIDTRIWSLYSINFPNGKRYIGITCREKERWKEHKNWSQKGEPMLVCRALKKYPDASFSVLVRGNQNYIAELEIAVIKKFKTRDLNFGYNVALGGQLSPMLVPEIAKKAKERLKAARIADPSITARSSITHKATLAANPEIKKQQIAAKMATEAANPDIILRRIEKRKVTVAENPNIIARQVSSRKKTLLADPSIQIRINEAHKATYIADPTLKIRKFETLRKRLDFDSSIKEKQRAAWTAERRLLQSIRLRGKKRSEEIRAKISAGNVKNWMKRKNNLNV
jgi:GIY-YIG catalytic domain